MQISDKGLSLIKRYEGLRLKAYLCPANVWTIGYGHTHQVKKDDEITEDIATEYLKKDVRWAQGAVDKYVKVELDQHQYDALVSFIFNCGAGAFRKSTLLRMLNKGQYDGAANQFRRWNKAKGRVLRGLTRRRADEAELFSDHSDDGMPQAIDAPKVKTKLNSKTNWAAGAGSIGVIASQADNIGKVVDKITAATEKGGDLADKVGGLSAAGILPIVAIVLVVGLFAFIMYERNRKIKNDGL